MSEYQEEPGRDYRKERDAAYTERNRLVAALARLYPSHLADHRDKSGENWDPEWRTVVVIDGPTGQLSWHLHDSDVPLFEGLPRGANDWDGHTTEEKYARIARIGTWQAVATRPTIAQLEALVTTAGQGNVDMLPSGEVMVRQVSAPVDASGCARSGCDVVDVDQSQCPLARPVGIAVPPGQHQHVPCPVHGDHLIRG